MPLSAQLAVYQGSPAAQAVSCLSPGRDLCHCGPVVITPAGLSHELQEAHLHLIIIIFIFGFPLRPAPLMHAFASSSIHSPLITSRDT